MAQNRNVGFAWSKPVDLSWCHDTAKTTRSETPGDMNCRSAPDTGSWQAPTTIDAADFHIGYRIYIYIHSIIQNIITCNIIIRIFVHTYLHIRVLPVCILQKPFIVHHVSYGDLEGLFFNKTSKHQIASASCVSSLQIDEGRTWLRNFSLL